MKPDPSSAYFHGAHPQAENALPQLRPGIDNGAWPRDPHYDLSSLALTSDSYAYDHSIPHQPAEGILFHGLLVQPSASGEGVDSFVPFSSAAYDSFGSDPAQGSFSSVNTQSMSNAFSPVDIGHGIEPNEHGLQTYTPTSPYSLHSGAWAAAVRIESTVSPKELRIQENSPSPPVYSPHVAGGYSSDHDVSHEAMQLDSPVSNRQPLQSRKELPDKAPRTRFVPILPSTVPKATKRKPSSSDPTGATMEDITRKQGPIDDTEDGENESQPLSNQPRSAKDEYLIKAKMDGLTYREIRIKGGFKEAESTLRGRFRTLTKNKRDRVRKPEWMEDDVSSFCPV
jgi:hypothetical protein